MLKYLEKKGDAPGTPSVNEFDEFIEMIRLMITQDEDAFRRDIDINSLSSVYVYLRDSAKFMYEYLHVNFPDIDLLRGLEEDSVEGFEYRLRSSLTSMILVYIDRLYGDKTNSEKMQVYKNRVLSMKIMREFYRGKNEFDVMDIIIDDLEELINDMLEEDEEFLFSSGDLVVDKSKLPISIDLEGYNWSTIFRESRMRNRRM